MSSVSCKRRHKRGAADQPSAGCFTKAVPGRQRQNKQRAVLVNDARTKSALFLFKSEAIRQFGRLLGAIVASGNLQAVPDGLELTHSLVHERCQQWNTFTPTHSVDSGQTYQSSWHSGAVLGTPALKPNAHSSSWQKASSASQAYGGPMTKPSSPHNGGQVYMIPANWVITRFLVVTMIILGSYCPAGI